MRLGLLLLLLACGACQAAPEAVADAWLLDPVGAVLAAADTSAATPVPGEPEGLISLDYLKVIVELAAVRPDIGPEFSAFLKDFVATQ